MNRYPSDDGLDGVEALTALLRNDGERLDAFLAVLDRQALINVLVFTSVVLELLAEDRVEDLVEQLERYRSRVVEDMAR